MNALTGIASRYPEIGLQKWKFGPILSENILHGKTAGESLPQFYCKIAF